MYAHVLLFQKTGLNTDTLTYGIPDGMVLEVGALVQVPLRKSLVRGIILGLTEKKNIKGSARPVDSILHSQLLPKWRVELLEYLAKNFHTPRSVVAKHLLPPYLRESKGVSDEMLEMLSKTMHTKRLSVATHKDPEVFISQKSSEILEHLCRTIRKYKKGQIAIVAPEIAIEPFWTSALERDFEALNYYSAKTPKQKAVLWKEIFEGKHRVVYGSRSVLLAPFSDLRAIIVMNEHSVGHKEDQRPKFHSRELAFELQKFTGADLHFIGPSLSVPLSFRLKKNAQPDVERRDDTQFKMVDMRAERKRGNFAPISEDLDRLLRATLEHKSQAILYLNKRGQSSCLLCRDCGYIPKCHICKRNLIVQRHPVQGHILTCIAGEILNPVPEACPRCGNISLKMVGIGQEKLADTLQQTFPDARIVIYSKERAKTPKEQKKILHAFTKGEIDILITTQLLYSGVPIPQVPVVAALDIDTSLVIPHFTSGEKTVHHLQEMQSFLKPKGVLLLQTYIPETPLLMAYKDRHLSEWYEKELKSRKTFKYPPYSKIMVLTSTLREGGREGSAGKKSLEQTLEYIRKTEPDLTIELTKKNIGHRDKYYLVIRGADPEKAMNVIRSMPDVALDIDSPYLI